MKLPSIPRGAQPLASDARRGRSPALTSSTPSRSVTDRVTLTSGAPPSAAPPVYRGRVQAFVPTTTAKDVPGYDPANLDTTVRPQDDFFQYAVGGYMASHPIPADKSSWGVDAELNQRVQNTLHDILENLPSDSPHGTNEQKLRDFYRSGMDQARIDAAGIGPLKPELDRIAAIKDMGGVQDQIAHMHAIGFGGMFTFGATADFQDPEMTIGEADQGGLSLPNRDYYLSTDAQKSSVRGAFVDHMTKMLGLAGDNPLHARLQALQVLTLETRLAEGCLTPEQLRDPRALYNPMDRTQLAALTPHFDWNRYFAGIGRPDINSINVGMPDFFSKLDKTLASTTVDQWKTYMKWQIIHQMAPYLSKDIEQEDFNFNGTVLTGATVQSDRWQRVVKTTDNYLGEALGQKFVQKAFPPEAKAKAVQLVQNVMAALRDKIQNGWMDAESQKGALAKVDGLHVKIGYPDKWKDYSAFDVQDDVYASNVLRGNAFAAQDSLATIGKPTDHNAWGMTPSTVNAYYNATGNEIVVPAAILQPPYFDLNADDAANYGATGATIGHELSHGFDDEGSQFDASGKLNPWMTKEDQAKFDSRADGVARQFDEFSYDGQKVNGHLVEGESIADLGGLELAWAAFQKAKASSTAAAVKTDDGFTPQQRFYLNYALSWATAMRPERAHLLLSNDPHPLPQFRVIGPLANLPPFFEAFKVQPGDPMMRPEDKRNKLWNP